MLIAIYSCRGWQAVNSMLTTQDLHESMEVISLAGEDYIIVYKTPHLRAVATDVPPGVTLQYQKYFA